MISVNHEKLKIGLTLFGGTKGHVRKAELSMSVSTTNGENPNPDHRVFFDIPPCTGLQSFGFMFIALGSPLES